MPSNTERKLLHLREQWNQTPTIYARLFPGKKFSELPLFTFRTIADYLNFLTLNGESNAFFKKVSDKKTAFLFHPLTKGDLTRLNLSILTLGYEPSAFSPNTEYLSKNIKNGYQIEFGGVCERRWDRTRSLITSLADVPPIVRGPINSSDNTVMLYLIGVMDTNRQPIGLLHHYVGFGRRI